MIFSIRKEKAMKKYYIILAAYLFTAVVSIGVIYSFIPSAFIYLFIPAIIVPPIISWFFHKHLYRIGNNGDSKTWLYLTAFAAAILAAAFLGVYYEYPNIDFLNVLFFCIVSTNVCALFVALPMYLSSLFFKR